MAETRNQHEPPVAFSPRLQNLPCPFSAPGNLRSGTKSRSPLASRLMSFPDGLVRRLAWGGKPVNIFRREMTGGFGLLASVASDLIKAGSLSAAFALETSLP